MNRRIMIFATPEKTAAALARQIAAMIDDTPADATFSLALSGGGTPELTYEILGEEYGDQLSWEKVHFFWSDERYVLPDDENSNFGMAREALLDHIDVPEDNIHPVRTETMDPMSSAHVYQDEIVEHFASPTPRFDLILLGMGEDGHTASLFPGSKAVQEQRRYVAPVKIDAEPRRRLTFTYPLINRAHAVFFLVTGERKAEAVHKVLEEDPDIDDCPAAGVAPEDGRCVWWLDEAAASRIAVSAMDPPTKTLWTPDGSQSGD